MSATSCVRVLDSAPKIHILGKNMTPLQNYWCIYMLDPQENVASMKYHRFRAPQCCEVFGFWFEESAWQQGQDEEGIRPQLGGVLGFWWFKATWIYRPIA